MEVTFRHNEKSYTVNVIKRGEQYVVDLENRSFTVNAAELKPGHMVVESKELAFKTIVSSEGDKRYVFWGGQVYRLDRVEKARLAAEVCEKVSGKINSPISGKVVKLSAEAGKDVEANHDLLIIEAMKMEYRVRAPFKSKVVKVHHKEGDQVEIGELLVELEEPKEQEEG